MFNRTGAPAKIDKVIAFNVKDAKEVFCPNCSAYTGLSSGGTYKSAGKMPEIPLPGFQAKCQKCGSSFNV
jgi:transposase-like protein